MPSFARLLVLLLGPVILIAAAYGTTRAVRASTAAERSLPAGAVRIALSRAPSDRSALAPACGRAASALARQLEPGSHILVHPPFVVAGDCSAAKLDDLLRQTIVPVCEALRVSYFDHLPHWPITIVVLSNPDSFRRHAGRLDGHRDAAYTGYYQRSRLRIVVDRSSGDGTLAHELTHALAHADFPSIPEWLDEGLAALHEQSEFTPDGRGLVGLPNGRWAVLREAISRDRIPSLRAVMTGSSIRGEAEGLNYAIVRYFCLYLQQRELLRSYYRRFREAARTDPTGVKTLCEVLGKPTLAAVERDFHTWLRSR